MIRDQVKTFADAGQHAQRQHIDLHHIKSVDVVLVPFDESAVIHRRVADRHIAVEPVLGQHEAADMLRQMAREFDQFCRQFDGEFDHRILGIETRLLDLHFVEAVAPASPHRIGQRRRHVFRQPQRLADVADGAARPVMNHGCDDSGAVTAISPVDILHHLLAPRMLEVDVDVGRLQPFLGNETLEQQIDLGRIDGSNAEYVAHGRVRRRTPALAEDFLLARVANDVVHGEKIVRIFELPDQAQFLVQNLFGLG